MKTLSRIYMGIVFFLLYAPIVIMMLFSFNETKSIAVFSGFSLRWYADLFRNDAAAIALKNTLLLALLSSVIATVLGTVAAIGLDRMRNRHYKSLLTSVTNIPMMNPDIVTAISMLMFFVFVGNLLRINNRSFYTILIAHITFNLPYVLLSVLPKLRQMDKNLPEAAMDLGCTPLQSFFRVELPFILPGIFTGLLMAFTLSLDDFIITQFTKGEGFYTLPTYIYSMTKRTVKPDMYALSTLIFLAILACLIISNVVQARAEAHQNSSYQRKRSKK